MFHRSIAYETLEHYRIILFSMLKTRPKLSLLLMWVEKFTMEKLLILNMSITNLLSYFLTLYISLYLPLLFLSLSLFLFLSPSFFLFLIHSSLQKFKELRNQIFFNYLIGNLLNNYKNSYMLPNQNILFLLNCGSWNNVFYILFFYKQISLQTAIKKYEYECVVHIISNYPGL